MKTCWLNKQNNKNLIVFFAGWSFDSQPFCDFCSGKNCDILMAYDYNSMEIPQELIDLQGYANKTLIGWSMGVFVAYQNRKLFGDFDCKIAINGTVTPVDDNFGIPVKIFELTLKHAETGLRGKFYKNVFQTQEEFEKYQLHPVLRSIENRVAELESLYAQIKQLSNEEYEKFYDCAIVCESDKIIPPANQKASHDKNNVPVISLPYGHCPFYRFSKWDEIIELCR